MKIKLSNREILLVTAVSALLILYVLFQVLFVPKLNQVQQTGSMLSSINRELKVADQKLVLLQKLEQTPLLILRLKKTKEEQTIEALRHVSQVVSQLNLDLMSIRPRREEKVVGSAKAILFDIDFIGSYSNIYRFMQALEKLPILVLVDSIDMKRGDKAQVVVSVVLSVYY